MTLPRLRFSASTMSQNFCWYWMSSSVDRRARAALRARLRWRRLAALVQVCSTTRISLHFIMIGLHLWLTHERVRVWAGAQDALDLVVARWGPCFHFFLHFFRTVAQGGSLRVP